MPFEILSDEDQGSRFVTMWQNLLRLKPTKTNRRKAELRDGNSSRNNDTLLETQLDTPLRLLNQDIPLDRLPAPKTLDNTIFIISLQIT